MFCTAGVKRISVYENDAIDSTAPQVTYTQDINMRAVTSDSHSSIALYTVLWTPGAASKFKNI